MVTTSEAVDTFLEFGDREKLWDIIFWVDMILWLVKRLINLPEPWGLIYEILSNGFFAVWLMRVWIIRKKYFKVEVYLDDYADNVYEKGFFENELVRRGIDLRGFVNKIPSRVKMMLTYGKKIPKKPTPHDVNIIRSSLYTFFAITLYALNKDMKVSVKKLNEIYSCWMLFNFECLAEKNRLSMYDIVLVIADECSYLDPRYEKVKVGE